MTAGGSASRRAQEARRQERLLREQWQVARQQARRWEAAGDGERRVAAQMLVLTARGWRLLVDRRWPGTRAANVDMLFVGPGGVFVIDVKNWRSGPEPVREVPGRAPGRGQPASRAAARRRRTRRGRGDVKVPRPICDPPAALGNLSRGSLYACHLTSENGWDSIPRIRRGC
ncbi:NERD domain-containing protein [Streptomyces odontomachi]|uniref:NERD domain-containing protein n=1 Tax=Streptomyces odontomachi TaxID=2944940 RepID=UPI002108C042|nr:NERD domain-containing protein [Streptomyces sp. ODS25]